MPLPAFLKSGETAFAWAEKHLDLTVDDDPEIAEDELLDYRDKADTYSRFASRAVARGRSLLVYRAVCVQSKGKIELDNLGKAWSAELSGVGCYNPGARGKQYVIEAEVSPADVDWEYGFASFMYYGEQQWEISMEKDAPVLVLAIDDERFSPPLLGNTGHAREGWKSRR